MREYRSEFSPEHGVWVLKRVECEAQQEEEGKAPTVPLPSSTPQAQRLRLVEPKPAAHT